MLKPKRSIVPQSLQYNNVSCYTRKFLMSSFLSFQFMELGPETVILGRNESCETELGIFASNIFSSAILMPIPLIFCGPSGVGKSSLIKKLFAFYPNSFGLCCSHTSRKPRAGEQNGREYHFTTREEFKASVEQGCFIENAEFAGNLYGTSYDAVEYVLNQGQNVVLDIDMQGVIQMKRNLKNNPIFKKGKPLYFFIAPPSVGELENRLRARATEDEDGLNRRLEASKKEIEWGTTSGEVDYVLVNDNLDNAFNELVDILKREKIISA